VPQLAWGKRNGNEWVFDLDPGTPAPLRPSLSNGHWMPDEGRALRDLLSELSAAGVPSQDIRVISPFRKVVSGCKGSAKAEFGRDFAKDKVGTVHTVQGQEAVVVVLVLGTKGQRRGAELGGGEAEPAQRGRVQRKAPAVRPRNLTNWQDLPYFHELAHALPVRSHVP
jgi:hypothetical protein